MPHLQSLNVLLVDDNQHMRTIAAAVLHSADIHRVYEAGDGSEAFEVLRRQPIDLALVDYNMFPMDGVEFTRRVRNRPDSANIYLPIIMMSGHAEKHRVYAARDAGVTEFLLFKSCELSVEDGPLNDEIDAAARKYVDLAATL